MIAQSEYLANLQVLKNTAQAYEDELRKSLDSVTRITHAVELAKAAAKKYEKAFADHMSTTLAEVGNTSVDHYAKQLSLDLSDKAKQEIVARSIMRQVDEPYYGATLEQRVSAAQREMQLRIKRSAQVGVKLDTRKENLARIFLHRYPFGAQFHTHQRIMLGQSVKLEHDISRTLAEHADVRLVKWTLSHRHKVRDICDDYAENYDEKVATYMKEHFISLDPAGIYFLEEAPQPPHPNCQCVLVPIYRGRLTSTIVDRVLDKVKDLLGKLGFKRRK